MNIKVDTNVVKEDKGIVYVLVFHMEDKELVKIGITNKKRIEDRVTDILASIFKKYRVFPRCEVKKFTTTTEVFKKENVLHKKFKDSKYITKYKFSGHTEFFDIEVDKVIEAYEELIG